MFRKIWILFFVFGVCFHCGAKTPESFSNDKLLYEYAQKLFQNKDYTEAITFFESLKNRFPSSPYVMDSEFKIAESYFEKGEFAEAEISYQNFRTLHPTHSSLPHVVLRMAFTHVERIPGGVDRDQSHREKAIQGLEEVLSRWPEGEEAKQARPLLQKFKQDLAKREVYIATFYIKQKKWDAAVARLKPLASDPVFDSVWEEAMYKLAWVYVQQNNPSEAKNILSDVVQRPSKTSYNKKSKQLLKKLSPG